jgi:signal transduction histidine kinase
LLNILINAIEAVSERGEVSIKTKLTEEECIIVILDNGLGIEQDQLSELFDPFYTGKKKGLGLGLTSTLSILNSHGANIEVKSELGQGTKFTITFKRE